MGLRSLAPWMLMVGCAAPVPLHGPVRDGDGRPTPETCRGPEPTADPLAAVVSPVGPAGSFRAAEREVAHRFYTQRGFSSPTDTRAALAVLLEAAQRGAHPIATYLVALAQKDLGLHVAARANATLAATQAQASTPPRTKLADAARTLAVESAAHVASVRFVAPAGSSAWFDGREVPIGAPLEVVEGEHRVSMFRDERCLAVPVVVHGKARVRVLLGDPIDVLHDPP